MTYNKCVSREWPTEPVNIGASLDSAICSQALLSPAMSMCAAACIVLRSDAHYRVHSCGRFLSDRVGSATSSHPTRLLVKPLLPALWVIAGDSFTTDRHTCEG